MTRPPFAKLLPQMLSCSGCGQCLPTCPTYGQSQIETDSPRGRISLARSFAEEKIGASALAFSFSRCLLCGRCEAACPQRLPLQRIFWTIRPFLRKFLPLAHKRLIGLLARDGKLLDLSQRPLRLVQDICKTGSPRLASRAFKAQTPKKGKALLFGGCLARRFFPDLLKASMKALEGRGIEPVWAEGLVCCGLPQALQGGNLKGIIRRNLKILAGYEFEWLTSPCPGCLAAISSFWPAEASLPEADREAASRLAGKCMDINLLLAQAGAEGGISDYYWHSPCLLDKDASAAAKKLAGIRDEGSETGCCGAPLNCFREQRPQREDRGKLFGPEQAGLMAGLAKNVRRRAGRGRRIITACPGCMLALGARHALEVYMEGPSA